MKKLILLLLFIPLVSIGQGNIKLVPDTTLETSSIDNVFKINNPFLNCDINDNSCFQNLISRHILNNFYYPQLGNYFDIQATVNVNYTIDKNGIVKNVSSNVVLFGVAFEDNESKKVISSAFEKAANSIIESLPKINPSVVNDTALNKKFRTPIHYKLVDIEKGFINSININKVNEGLNILNKLNKKEFTIDDYKFVQPPVFPGCEKKSKSKKRDCFQKKMQLHIIQNFKYPKLAQEMAIQGRVFVQFMIGVDGNIRRLRARGAHPILGKDAERIILLLPKIKPGKVNGFRIRVPFSIPITYTLN